MDRSLPERLDVRAQAAAERRIARQVRQSWLRCRTEFALEPGAQRNPSFVGRAELRRRRGRMGALYAMATLEMQSLAALMQAPVGITLSDADGVILAYLGDAAFNALSQRAGLREGAVWSEAEQGTNGMGTCLATREPVLIRAGEHYLRQNTLFACCAAPLHDAHGRIVGALNLSCPHELSWAPTMALLTRAAEAIEVRAMLDTAQEFFLLRLHRVPALLTTAGEGLLLLDAQGRVAGATPAAARWLQARSVEALLDRDIEALGGRSLAELQRLARLQPWQPQALPACDLYALLRLPQAEPPLPAPLLGADAAGALARAERAALLQVIEACGWNLSLAARQLRLGRKTLYRKLHRYGLLRPQRDGRRRAGS